MRFRLFTAILFLSVVGCAQKEKPAFWNDIQEFKKQDIANPPASGQILFIGSSSFTRWRDVQDYFPGYPILNRGFGGSSLFDVIRYANDIIFPYQPKQIVLYIGENDFAGSDTVSVATVLVRFKDLYRIIRNRLPTVPLVYVSMKPSPSRLKLLPKFVEANAAIRDFLATKQNTVFVDVYSKMINADGQPVDEIFVGDKLHMNANGYAIWKKEIEPYLAK